MLSLDGLDLDMSRGELLSRDAYKLDFRKREWEVGDRDSWKLERRQHFQEPGRGSWEAFSKGDWEGALRLIEERREALLKLSREAAEHRVGLYRVRVAEEPLTPYLQWEIHLLRLRAECGELVSVVGPDTLGELEARKPLPEVLTLGGRTLYQIRYNDQGVLEGAVRYEDAELVARWEECMKRLFAEGEDMGSYFDRAVSHLTSPHPE